MANWRTLNGVDWLVAGGLPESPAEVEFGLVLAHGYAQESPADLGIGSAAMAALSRELARPRETSDHRVVQVQTGVAVHLQDSVLLLRGDVESVRLAVAALDQLLSDPTHLDTADLPDQRRWAWSGWTQELRAWFGMGTPALAAHSEAAWPTDDPRLREFVRSLHPARGRRAVIWVSDPALAGVAFDQPLTDQSEGGERSGGPVPSGPPLEWRTPAPTAAGPGSLVGTYENNVLTARVPASRAQTWANRVLAQTVYRSLVEFSASAAGLDVTAELVGSDQLVAVRAEPHERGFDPAVVRAGLLEALEATAGFPDQVLEQEIARARAPESIEADLQLLGRAIDALRSGTRPSPAEIVAELDALTVADLREGLARLRSSSLLGVSAIDPPPVASPAEPASPAGPTDPADRSLFLPPVLAPVRRPYLGRRGVIPQRTPAGLRRQSVRVTPETLQQTLKPVRGSGQARGKSTTTAVDLTAIVVRADEGSDRTTLIDREGRRVNLTWPTYWRVAPLRALVDDATPASTRMTSPAEPALAADLRRRLRTWRIGLVVQAVVYSGLLVLLILGPVTGRGQDQKPVVTTVSAGSVVTLGNGSTVAVSGGGWQQQAQRPRGNLTADVRYCGGGVTVDRDTGDDARNYVTPDRFEVTGIDPASRRSLVPNPRDLMLQATQLDQGQCTEGKIGFEIDAGELPPGTRIRYHNGSHDDISWTVG